MWYNETLMLLFVPVEPYKESVLQLLDQSIMKEVPVKNSPTFVITFGPNRLLYLHLMTLGHHASKTSTRDLYIKF